MKHLFGPEFGQVKQPVDDSYTGKYTCGLCLGQFDKSQCGEHMKKHGYESADLIFWTAEEKG